METYDILMLVVLAGATLFGAIKGFAWQVASIASIVVSYVVAYRFREPFSEAIKADPPWNRFLAMLILYVGTSLVIWVVFRMLSRSIDRMKLKEFDRQIGAAFGLAKGALFCILITMFAVTLFGDELREKIVGSRSGMYIARVLDKSDLVIPPELHEVVAPYIERFEASMAEGGVPKADSAEEGSGIDVFGLGGLAGEDAAAESDPLGVPGQWSMPWARQASNPDGPGADYSPLPVNFQDWVPPQR